MRTALAVLMLTLCSRVESLLCAPDLTGYTLVYDEEFNGPLSVSAYGPGTKWIAHTPYGGDFGEAWFSSPTEPKS
ncbi:MAG: glycoside hydrolase family 16 protein, partial [Verrucomicrobia bacterium]|nr:glycoside hydrolase family 16 protein [Verrucomicrobiota bacterium]